MKKILKLVSSAAVLLLITGLLVAGSAAAEDALPVMTNLSDSSPLIAGNTPTSYVEGQLMVRFDVTTEDGSQALDSVSPLIIKDYGSLVPGMVLIKTPEGMTVPEAVAYYSGLPGVIFAEPDYYVNVNLNSEQAETAPAASAKSPVGIPGILAGLGAAAALMKRRR